MTKTPKQIAALLVAVAGQTALVVTLPYFLHGQTLRLLGAMILAQIMIAPGFMRVARYYHMQLPRRDR